MVVMFQKIELVLVAVGLLLLAVWGVARFHGAVSAKTAIAEFEAARAENLADSTSPSLDRTLSSPVDFRLWSPKRIAAYKVSLAEKTDLPLAILRIPKINLEVPVFNDTDDLTLDRGVGRFSEQPASASRATWESQGIEMAFSAVCRALPKAMSLSWFSRGTQTSTL